MADISNITPVKPLWPKRRDEKNPEKEQPGHDKEKDKQSPNAEKPDTHNPDPDHDGQIDEYV